MKVLYFNVYGRAEALRMMLTHSKTEFEDVRMSREEFTELKASGKLEFGQVPALELEDGQILTQSGAIARYVGAKYGYYPADHLKAYECDSMCDALDDLFAKMIQMFYGPNEEAKAAAGKAFAEDHLPLFLERLDKRLAGKKYFGGETPDVFDFHIGAFLSSPAVAKFQENVDKHSGVKAHQENWAVVFADYLANRPQCNM